MSLIDNMFHNVMQQEINVMNNAINDNSKENKITEVIYKMTKEYTQ